MTNYNSVYDSHNVEFAKRRPSRFLGQKRQWSPYDDVRTTSGIHYLKCRQTIAITFLVPHFAPEGALRPGPGGPPSPQARTVDVV